MQPESNDQQPATPGWEYKPGDSSKLPTVPSSQVQPTVSAQPQPPLNPSSDGIEWSASEFVAHQKNIGWYGLLLLAGVFGAGVIYILTRDLISTGFVVVVVVILGIFAARKPRTLDYRVDKKGIHIGAKSYSYAEFKSFAVVDEGAFNSIAFIPMKRFMPAISVYYEPKDEEQIIGALSNYLPVEEGKKDAIDKFMHKIRF